MTILEVLAIIAVILVAVPMAFVIVSTIVEMWSSMINDVKGWFE